MAALMLRHDNLSVVIVWKDQIGMPHNRAAFINVRIILCLQCGNPFGEAGPATFIHTKIVPNTME